MSSPSVQIFQPGCDAGGISIARLVLPHADGKRAGDVVRLALGVFHADDQHVLGEPAFLSRLVAGDAQRVALLAEQGVAAVARADALDREFFGEMHDQASLGIQVAGRVQSLDEMAVTLDTRERRSTHARHEFHIDDDIRAVGNFDTAA